MRELVLPSKAKHYGNKEVVLLDREHDIKGYGGNSYVWFCVCGCVQTCVFGQKGSSAGQLLMDEVLQIHFSCYHGRQGHRHSELINI